MSTPEQHLVHAKHGLGLPVIVVICGSTRFMREMAEADLRETVAGRIVVRPGRSLKEPHPLWDTPAKADALKPRLDDLHRAKIRLADEILVVGDYIGDSTRSEIDYARSLGKPIRYTHPDVDPHPDPLPASSYELSLATGGTLTLSSVQPVPGLHVYAIPLHLREEGWGEANPWRLGHHSGRGMAAFPTEDDALRGAREIADLTDWTRSAAELHDDPDFDQDTYLDRFHHRTNACL